MNGGETALILADGGETAIIMADGGETALILADGGETALILAADWGHEGVSGCWWWQGLIGASSTSSNEWLSLVLKQKPSRQS